MISLKKLVFHDLQRATVKFVSATKTASKILITTLINVQNVEPMPNTTEDATKLVLNTKR